MPIKNNVLIKRIVGFSIASWINLIVSFFATPVVTKFFIPEELGKINLFTSYANLLIPFVYLGFDQAYVRFFNEPCGKNDKYSLLKICLIMPFVMSIIIGIVILLLGEYFSIQIIGYSNIFVPIFLWLFIFGTVVLRFLNLTSRMENNILLYTIQSVALTLITKLLFVLVALIEPSALNVIVFKSILIFIISLIFAVNAKRKFTSTKVDLNKEVIKELTKYAIPIFPTVFLVMLNSSLSQILLKNYVDYQAVGIYSNALSIASIIIVVQAGLNTFWTPFVYEYYESDPEKIKKFHHIISFLMIFAGLAIILFQDFIYIILVNKQYWGSKSIFALLLLSPISITISETLGLGVEISKKTILKIPIYIINIVVNIVSNVILLPRFGVLGAAISTAISSFSMLIAKTIIGEKYYKCSDNYIKLCVGLLLITAISFINYFFNSHVLTYILTIVSIILLILVYLREVKIIKKNGIEFIKTFRRR